MSNLLREELEFLNEAKRTNQILRGVVKTVSSKKISNGYLEMAHIMLENGTMVICPKDEFSVYKHSTIRQFAGSIQEFIVKDVNLTERFALVSVKDAQNIKRNTFLNQLRDMEIEGTLESAVFEATVSGVNVKTNNIMLTINGCEAYMYKRHWDYNRIKAIEDVVSIGETVPVKILRYDTERHIFQLSRKAAMDDPFDKIHEYKQMLSVAGRVTSVDKINGIYVMLDNGLEVKAMKPRAIEEPLVGEVVTCRVHSINEELRHAKVVITGYPRKKMRVKNVASFLFE